MNGLKTQLLRGSLCFALLLLAACSSRQPVQTLAVQQTPTTAATLEPTLPLQETVEAQPTPTVSTTASPTPDEGPQPLDPGAISAENLKEVIELSRWGRGTLQGVVYSPDGSQVAVKTALGIYLYDAESLLPTDSFPAATAAYGAAFSPDWSTLAWGEGSTVRLLRTTDDIEVLAFETEAGTVQDLRFSPDGSQLALMVRPPGEEVYSNLAEIRQVSDGSLLNRWDLQGMGWAFSPDWKTLASWYAMTGLHLWGLPGGEPLPFPAEIAMISTAVFSPDGSLLATAGGPEGDVQQWRLPDGALLRAMQGENQGITGLAFSPDGSILAGATQNGPTQVWKAADGSLLQTIPSGPGGAGLAAFSPDGAELALKSNQGLTFWNIPDGTANRSLEGHFGPLRQMAFDPANGTAAALAGIPPADHSLLLSWRLSEREPFYTSDPVEALSLALSPDGTTTALGMWDGTVQILRALDGQLLHTLSGHQAQVQSAAFSPDRATLASSSMEEVRLWSVQDGQLLQTLPVPGGWVTDVTFSPDGGLLATFSADGQVRLWQASDGSPIEVQMSSPEAGWDGALAFSPDGSTLALGTHLSVLLWKIPEGSLTQTISLSEPAAATSLAFSPDGALLAAGLSDGSIEWWKAGEAEPAYSQAGHTDMVTGLAFSDDGLFLVSASLDGTMRMWGLSGAR
jgi:WD40 repeat protein